MATEREAAGIVREHESFFNEGLRLRQVQTESDDWQQPIILHPVIAAGSLVSGTLEEREATKLALEQLLVDNEPAWFSQEEERAFSQGHICEGITYGFLYRQLSGMSQIDAAEDLISVYDIMGDFSLGKSHNLAPFDGTSIFFDWDGTCTGNTFSTNHRLRPGLIGFLESLLAKEGVMQYQTFITTNTNSTQSFIERYKKMLFQAHEGSNGKKYHLFDLFDAIDTVPGIAPVKIDKEGNMEHRRYHGKLYTELLQTINIPPEKALIFCDSHADRNADTQYPITTVVTGKHVTGEDWGMLLAELERRGSDMHEAYHTFGAEEQVGKLTIYQLDATPYVLYAENLGNKEETPSRERTLLAFARRFANGEL